MGFADMAGQPQASSHSKNAGFDHGNNPGRFVGYENALVLEVGQDYQATDYVERDKLLFWEKGRRKGEPKVNTPVLAWVPGLNDPSVPQDDGVRVFHIPDHRPMGFALGEKLAEAAGAAGLSVAVRVGDSFTIGYSKSSGDPKQKNWRDHAAWKIGNDESQRLAVQKLREHREREERLEAAAGNAKPSGFAGQVHDVAPASGGNSGGSATSEDDERAAYEAWRREKAGAGAKGPFG